MSLGWPAGPGTTRQAPHGAWFSGLHLSLWVPTHSFPLSMTLSLPVAPVSPHSEMPTVCPALGSRWPGIHRAESLSSWSLWKGTAMADQYLVTNVRGEFQLGHLECQTQRLPTPAAGQPLSKSHLDLRMLSFSLESRRSHGHPREAFRQCSLWDLVSCSLGTFCNCVTPQ